LSEPSSESSLAKSRSITGCPSHNRGDKLGLFSAVFVIIKKIEYYSADPVGEKNCPPLFPDFVGDPSKQNTIEIDIPQYDFLWAQKGGFINDASCLNKTAVYGVVSIQNTDDIKNALISRR